MRLFTVVSLALLSAVTLATAAQAGDFATHRGRGAPAPAFTPPRVYADPALLPYLPYLYIPQPGGFYQPGYPANYWGGSYQDNRPTFQEYGKRHEPPSFKCCEGNNQ